jgi:nucleoporin NUP2
MTFGGAPGAVSHAGSYETCLISSQAAPPSRFGTFAGFGAPATSSTGFTFQAPKESSEFPVVPTFPSPSSSPLASATATPATKTFASFLTSAPAVAPPPPTVPTPSMPQSDDATMDTTDSDELEFYVSLRGLNQSFLEAVTKQVTDDPFFDLSVFFERYTAHRDDVQTKFDAGKGISKIKVPSAAVAPAVPATNGSAKPLGMPAVPATFTGFGSFKPGPTSSSPSTSGGFTPKLDSAPTTKSSGFSFPAPAGPSADVSKSSGAFGLVAPPKPAEDAGKKSHFTLAAPAAPSSDVPTSSVSKPTFAFGGSTAPSTDASRSAPSKPAFSFGAPSAPSAFTFGSSGAASTTTKPEAGKFGFGAGGFGFATKAGSGSAAENSAPASNTTSLFGSPTHTPGGDSGMNPFSVLGKPGAGTGSLGNPVGFTFGSPARTPDAAPASAIFAVPASEDDAASVNKSDSEDAPPPVLGVSVHDAPGEGEEDEEAVHEIRSKLYQLSKRSVDGSVAEYWADLGIGGSWLVDGDFRTTLMSIRYTAVEEAQGEQRTAHAHAEQLHRQDHHCELAVSYRIYGC